LGTRKASPTNGGGGVSEGGVPSLLNEVQAQGKKEWELNLSKIKIRGRPSGESLTE